MNSRPPVDCETFESGEVPVGDSRPPARPSADEAGSREELRDFVHAVTHDLRSPLVNVRGLSRELRTVLPELLGREPGEAAGPGSAPRSEAETVVAELLGHMETSVSRMDGMINQLVGFSRAACGELEFTAVDLGPVMARVLEQKAGLVEETGCVVEIGALPTVRADPIAMEVVFGELLGNALRFLSGDRPGRVTVFGETEGEVVRVVFRDNGRGIAERDLKRIFQPFRRVGALDRPGEGMGLAVVKALVGRHGGSVDCVSGLDEGCAVTLVLRSF